MKRRGFLKFLGGTAIGVTLGEAGFFALGPRSDPAFAGQRHDGLLHERTPLSICGGCPAGCSVRLRIVDGRVVGIRGNPACPISAGGLCARGASEVEAFYDPDRLLGPVARDDGTGLRRVSWDEAQKTIAGALEKARSAGAPVRVATILASGRGLTRCVAEAFHAEVGSPHLYQVDLLRDPAARAAAALGLGSEEPPTYDLSRASLVLSVDSPLLEGWLSPCHVSALFGAGRRRKEPLELIHIGSRMSATAMRADRWIRCRPGTETTLALGIARVLLREGLASDRALARIEGLEDWTDAEGKEHPGFARSLAMAYSTQTVARETGVPVVTILDVARRFGRARAPLAVGERLAGSAGVFGLAAVSLLNALVDQIGPSRTVVPRAPSALVRLTEAAVPSAPLVRPPTVALPGATIASVLAGLQREGEEPPFDVLFLEDGSVLGGLEPGDEAWKMLARIPLIVSFARSLDASVELAHLVLPSTTPYEQVSFVEAEPAAAIQAVAMARKAIDPIVDGRPIGQVYLDLAKALSLPLAKHYPTVEKVYDAQLERLQGLRRGTPYAGAFRHHWVEEQERAGWWSPQAATPEAFRRAVHEGGGWVDPVAPSGMSESAPVLALGRRAGAKARASSRLYPLPANDDAWMPRDELAGQVTGDGAGAFRLLPFTPSGFVGYGTPNRPSLLEYAGPAVLGAYRPWVEMNEHDGQMLGLEEGDEVRLISEHGTAPAVVRLTKLVAEGTVAVPWGGCTRGGGRYAKG
ncbi:MAG: hypothetical protein D6729_04230, partial [Deltaproteobacteria bacterium]